MSFSGANIAMLKEHYETILKCINTLEEKENADLYAINMIPNPLSLTDAQKMELFFLGLHTNTNRSIAYFSDKHNLPKKEVAIYLSEVRKQATSLVQNKPLLYNGDLDSSEEDSYVVDYPHMDSNFVRQLGDSLELDAPTIVDHSDDEALNTIPKLKEVQKSTNQSSKKAKSSTSSPSKPTQLHEPEIKKSKSGKDKNNKKQSQ